MVYFLKKNLNVLTALVVLTMIIVVSNRFGEREPNNVSGPINGSASFSQAPADTSREDQPTRSSPEREAGPQESEGAVPQERHVDVIGPPPIPLEDQRRIAGALNGGLERNRYGDVLLERTTDYNIVYLYRTDTFLISITNPDFEQTRLRAEQEFRALLGVSQTTLCKLYVSISTPSYANSSLAGKEFPLSFCT